VQLERLNERGIVFGDRSAHAGKGSRSIEFYSLNLVGGCFSEDRSGGEEAYVAPSQAK
jgi:hypothetical protein